MLQQAYQADRYWRGGLPLGTAGRVLQFPARDDIDLPIDEQLIVGFYSR